MYQDRGQDQHQDQEQNQDNKNIIIVCKDERDWINPETGKPYSDFNMCDINMITSKNMYIFQNSVIVLDDMGDKLIKDIGYYFTEGRHHNIQMIVICHKPAQIISTARMSSDTIYLTTFNGADLFKNFNEICKCEHKFYEIINELDSNYYIRTDGMSDELRYGMIKYNKKEKTFIIIDRNITMIYDSRVDFLDLKALRLKDKLESDEINILIAYMKPLIINATDRNTINTNNYLFYFNKLLTSRGIKIQYVLTKEIIKANALKVVSGISGIIGACFLIYNYMSPDSTVKTAALVTAGASNILNRTNTLFNYCYRDNDDEVDFVRIYE